MENEEMPLLFLIFKWEGSNEIEKMERVENKSRVLHLEISGILRNIHNLHLFDKKYSRNIFLCT